MEDLDQKETAPTTVDIYSKKELLSTALKRTSEWISSQEIPSDVTIQVGGSSFSLHKAVCVFWVAYGEMSPERERLNNEGDFPMSKMGEIVIRESPWGIDVHGQQLLSHLPGGEGGRLGDEPDEDGDGEDQFQRRKDMKRSEREGDGEGGRETLRGRKLASGLRGLVITKSK